VCTDDGFKPRDATRSEIEDRVRGLRGMILGDIPLLRPPNEERRNLGDIGVAIESWFGLEGDSLMRPDFWKAGIELKEVPLVKGAKGYRCSQKTFITVIDYVSMKDEEWVSAHVRPKLNTLLVFVEVLPGNDWRTFRVRDYAFRDFLADPQSSFSRLAESDWMRVKTRVEDCEAHLISASDGLVLTPATKGRDGRDKRRQSCGPKAMRRSFALRQSLMKAVYRDAVGSHPKAVESLLENLSQRKRPDLETIIQSRLGRYIGRTVAEVASDRGYSGTATSRSYGADVVQLALGASTPRARIIEFDEAGITLRRPRVNASFRPYEDISFPAFRAQELQDETWDTSVVKSLLEIMLFVPLVGSRRSTAIRDCKIGTPHFWRPHDEELRAIGEEWTELQSQLIGGQLTGLRRKHLHMRPHARNAKDTDTVNGHSFTRKSFWLNREIVATILTAGSRT